MLLIIGGGAAGLMAGVLLARAGSKVLILERNEKVGKKLFITGKGRCNLTNDCEPEDFLGAVMRNRRFLYSSIYGFTSRDTINFFESAGVRLKTERGQRVFPASDHSSDVIRALETEYKKAGGQLRLHTRIKRLLFEEGRAVGCVSESGEVFKGEALIVATGGLSYKSTGSTGDGYLFAREAGHTVTELSPSLVSLFAKEDYLPKMAGLSLKNVRLSIRSGKKLLFSDFGEMMFTHQGVTGPMILTASAVLSDALKKGPLEARLDLKPALSEEQLDGRILREFSGSPNKQFRNVIGALFPASLTPVIISLSGIDPVKVVHEITKAERTGLVGLIKAFPFTVTGPGGINEAIITRGGVNVKEIDPGSIASKKVKGLYFIGEVLDVDALTGGFNLQIAWATAAACARGFSLC